MNDCASYCADCGHSLTAEERVKYGYRCASHFAVWSAYFVAWLHEISNRRKKAI